jgi:hypothetical protein
MLRFDIETSVPRALLLAAWGDARVGSSISNLQYCFEFTPLQTRDNLVLANPLDGRMTCYLEGIPPHDALPPVGVNGWVALRHEDTPSGEGESSVTRPTRDVTNNGGNGPDGAHGGRVAAPAAALGGPHSLT